MHPLDYARSFLIGTAPMNEVRFWVESRTRLIDEHTGAMEDYLQCASCKSEDTFAKADLFFPDNYDFLPIFGPEFSVIFRRKAWLNPNYRSIVPTREAWAGPAHRLVERADARELTSSQAILDATYACEPIVAQTELHHPETGLRAIIEYPVKTLNTRREDLNYQTDTGPVAFPDLSMRPERLIDTLALAFVAFNAPHFADFVIEEPTCIPATEGAEPSVSMYHYSRRVSLPAVNRLYATP